MKIEPNIEFLIAGFLSDSLNDDEMNKLKEWLDEDAAHYEEFNKYRSAWILAGYETGRKTFDPRLSWQDIKKNIKVDKVSIIRRLTPLWRVASLLFCFMLGYTVNEIRTEDEQIQQKVLNNTSTTISASFGSKNNILLPDGSTVWLNAGSEITYSSNFGIDARDIQLTGEAFFDVKSDSLTPFIVHTADMTVKALGTRFNVKAFPNDNTIATTLEEGLVDVMIHLSGKTESRSISLKPKEQLVVNRKAQSEESQVDIKSEDTKNQTKKIEKEKFVIEKVTIHENVKTELSTSWKDEKWIIDNQNLNLFAADLERRYNLNIIFSSPELYDYKFSGTIENQTVEQIFNALSLAAPVNYIFKNNNVILSLNKSDKEKFTKILKNK